MIVLKGLASLSLESERNLCMLDIIGYFWGLYIFSFPIFIDVLNLIATIVISEMQCQVDEWSEYNSYDCGRKWQSFLLS